MRLLSAFPKVFVKPHELPSLKHHFPLDGIDELQTGTAENHEVESWGGKCRTRQIASSDLPGPAGPAWIQRRRLGISETDSTHYETGFLTVRISKSLDKC